MAMAQRPVLLPDPFDGEKTSWLDWETHFKHVAAINKWESAEEKGRQFESQLVKEVCKLLEIRKTHTMVMQEHVLSVCSPDVDKAVKDAVSAINNRDHVILYGLPETGSTIKDFETVKDIFDSLGVNDVKAVDVFRLGKVQSDVGVSQSKPRLLKVRLSSSIVHNSLLKKAKLLRDSSKYKSVFIRRSYSFVERSRIKELYNVLRQKKDETGREFFIDRRGNVGTWTVKERTTGSTATSGIGNTESAQPASNC
eukprot:Em0019g367a